MFNNGTQFTMPVAPANCYGNGNGNGMWGDSAWWIIILLIFGWGNNGNGFGNFGGGNNGAGYTDNAISRGFDHQSVVTKLDGITQGICDSTYALNNTITNGFHGVDNAICTLGYQTQAGQHALATQLAQCCCDTQRAIDGVNYNMATQACDTRNTIQNSTRDIVDNANANTRQILDFLVNDKIATLTSENQSLKFQASQAEQNAFITANQTAQTAELIRRLGADCPIPAYVVPNPNCCYNPFGFNYGNGYGNTCGCA